MIDDITSPEYLTNLSIPNDSGYKELKPEQVKIPIAGLADLIDLTQEGTSIGGVENMDRGSVSGLNSNLNKTLTMKGKNKRSVD
jgi:hypothetical protein